MYACQANKYDQNTMFSECCCLCYCNFWRTWVLFVGPLIPLFWTSVDVSSRFQSSGESRIFSGWGRQLPKTFYFPSYLLKTAWKWKNLPPPPRSTSAKPEWAVLFSPGRGILGVYRATDKHSTDCSMPVRLVLISSPNTPPPTHTLRSGNVTIKSQ